MVLFKKYGHWFWLLALGSSFIVKEMREAIPILASLLLGFLSGNWFPVVVTIALIALFLKQDGRKNVVVQQQENPRLTDRQLQILDYLAIHQGREIDTQNVVNAVGGNARQVALLADLERLEELHLISNEQQFLGRPARWEAGRNARRYLRERGLLD